MTPLDRFIARVREVAEARKKATPPEPVIEAMAELVAAARKVGEMPSPPAMTRWEALCQQDAMRAVCAALDKVDDALATWARAEGEREEK